MWTFYQFNSIVLTSAQMLPQNVTSIQLKLKYSNVKNGNSSLGSAVQCFQNFKLLFKHF